MFYVPNCIEYFNKILIENSFIYMKSKKKLIKLTESCLFSEWQFSMARLGQFNLSVLSVTFSHLTYTYLMSLQLLTKVCSISTGLFSRRFVVTGKKSFQGRSNFNWKSLIMKIYLFFNFNVKKILFFVMKPLHGKHNFYLDIYLNFCF